jgi:hypothetical protein
MNNNNLIIIKEEEVDELKENYLKKISFEKDDNKYLNTIISDLRNKYDALEYKYNNLEKEKNNISNIHKRLYVDYTIVERENFELRKDIYDLEIKNRKLQKKND